MDSFSIRMQLKVFLSGSPAGPCGRTTDRSNGYTLKSLFALGQLQSRQERLEARVGAERVEAGAPDLVEHDLPIVPAAGRGTKRYAVKGMIITGEPNAALERSLSERIPNYPVEWLLYRAEVKLYRRVRSAVRIRPGSKTEK